ncbi:hypothetical protein ACFLY9_01960 [Patescibacteria group bacterium]
MSLSIKDVEKIRDFLKDEFVTKNEFSKFTDQFDNLKSKVFDLFDIVLAIKEDLETDFRIRGVNIEKK